MNTSIYTQVPFTVIAEQWFPYKDLPGVQPIYGIIPNSTDRRRVPQLSASGEPVDNSLKVVYSGQVTLPSGDKIPVNPKDYVLYSVVTGQPVKVLSEKIFGMNYMCEDKLQLCGDCMKNVAAITGLDQLAIKQFEAIRAALLRGEPQTFGSLTFRTPEELDQYLSAGKQQ
jgi:hypothetical protein